MGVTKGLSQNPIDREEQLQDIKLTFEKLAFLFGTFRTKEKVRDRLGIKQYQARVGVQTILGDIERSLWERLMMRMILQNNEMALFSQLKEWYVESCAWLHSKSDAEKYTLECFSNRIFDDEKWVDYISFNKKYRPEILNNQTEIHQ